MPALLAVISHCRFNCQPDTSPWRRRPSDFSYRNPRDIVPGSLFRYRHLHALKIRRDASKILLPQTSHLNVSGINHRPYAAAATSTGGINHRPCQAHSVSKYHVKILFQWFSKAFSVYIDPSFLISYTNYPSPNVKPFSARQKPRPPFSNLS